MLQLKKMYHVLGSLSFLFIINLYFVSCTPTSEEENSNICNLAGENISQEDRTATPRMNEDAEILALESSSQMVAPQAIYDRINQDLEIIRSSISEVANIRILPSWAMRIMVSLTEEGKTQYSSNTFTEWDCLNEQFKMSQIEYLSSFSTDLILIDFDGRFNMGHLSEKYSNLPNVKSAEPDSMIGDGNDICLTQNDQNYSYIFKSGSGDCDSGCTNNKYLGVVTNPQGIIKQSANVTWRTCTIH